MADTSFSSESETSNGCTMMIIDTSVELDSSMSTIMQTPASQMSPSSLSRSVIKKQIEPSLTPATMSSAGSSPSLDSPFTRNSSVKMISMGTLHSDRPSTISVRTGVPAEKNQQQMKHRHEKFLQQSSHTQSVWVPLPSPSKPRLEPRYAARLAPSMRSGCPKAPSPRLPNNNTSFSSDQQGDLMPPPPVTRNPGIFRPSPISAPPFCAEDLQRSLHSLTPSSVIPSQHFFSSSTRCSSTASDVSTSTFSPSSKIITTPIRPSKRSKADIGVSDRFIPNRATSNFNFNLWEGVSRRTGNLSRQHVGTCRDNDDRSSNNSNSSNDSSADSSTHGVGNSLNTVSNSSRGLLSTLLRSELLGENENPMSSSFYGNGGQPRQGFRGSGAPLREGIANHLRFRSPRQEYQDTIFEDAVGPTAIVNSFSLTPIGSAATQRLMAVPPKRKRRISKVPFKVLDAPALQDDFYLNLVDWSSQNVLAVGLGSCVYLWSACTSKVTKLCDLASSEDIVTSVSWAQRGTHLSVGTNRGEVQLWDTIKCKKVRSMAGHTARVGTLAWTGPILASGSRDRLIYLRDVRVQAAYTDKLTNHKQEVCGLKWSFEEPSFLASGGNDNNLHVIDSRNPSEPLHKFSEHTAAVKAIAWSPHQHGLLASGGGTADRCIRFWNTLSGSSLNKIDTGSQVCNLAWSQNCNEIVSTHGYSLNQIVVWRYPSMSKVTTLTGHTYRVLYLAMSPDGSTIVTGAGDETLRFWQVFPGPRSDSKDSSGGLLFPNTLGSVIR